MNEFRKKEKIAVAEQGQETTDACTSIIALVFVVNALQQTYVNNALPRTIAFTPAEPVKTMKPDSLEVGQQFCGGIAFVSFNVLPDWPRAQAVPDLAFHADLSSDEELDPGSDASQCFKLPEGEQVTIAQAAIAHPPHVFLRVGLLDSPP